jgi:flavin reductase (DIM6/NTAB) family NADH-FMN oxidoreductase RutF
VGTSSIDLVEAKKAYPFIEVKFKQQRLAEKYLGGKGVAMRNFNLENSAGCDELAGDASGWELDAGPESLAFRSAMRRFVGGVTVITTLHEGRPWGMTVSAFTPACMEPPTVLVCINKDTVTGGDITKDRRFAVNILSQDQIEISQHCSRPREDKFVDHFVVPAEEVPGRVQMPVLKHSLITFDCRVNMTIVASSHLVILASVSSILAPAAKRPLLYGEGRYMHGVSLEAAAV